MKICILTHTFPKYKNDTTAAFMHPFVLGLLKTGNEVVVLTPYHKKLIVSDFPYRIVTYKYIWPDFFHILGYSQTLADGTRFRLSTYFLAPFLYLFGIFALLRLSKKEKFDCISSHWILPNGFIAFVVSRITKIPYSVSLAGSDVFISNKNFLFSLMARLAAKKAFAVCADSPQYITELKKTGAGIKERYIIPYPVDTSKINIKSKDLINLRRELGVTLGTIVLLAVGRLIQKKGFRYLIQALNLIIKKHKNVLLIVVGDGDLRGQLESLTKKLRIEEYVKFVGNVERNKIFVYYKVADVFIMPSIKDSQGNIDDRPVALLEAISAGIPVVATNFPGNKLSVKNKISGFLIPQKNINKLSQAILKLIASKDLRNSMSKEAQQLSRETLDIRKVGKKYHTVFQKIKNFV